MLFQSSILNSIDQNLSKLPLLRLATHSGWLRRRPRKITPLLWIKTFCFLATCPSVSLLKCAWVLSLLGGKLVSKQAVHKRLLARGQAFLHQVLCFLIQGPQKSPLCPALHHGMGPFKRVILQDSTLLALPQHLARWFPGPRNQSRSSSAQLRIQVAMDLLSHQLLHFGFSGFTRNDQRASADLLDWVQPADLVLRDLGYFVLEVFEQFLSRGVFFLSRLRMGLKLLDPDSGRELNLLRQLRRLHSLDIPVLLGRKARLPVRLVALPIPPAVAAERRRKAKANRDRRWTPSKEHLALLGWQIFITNTSTSELSPQTIAQLYSQRWRIETIFKAWKSHFSLNHIHPEVSLLELQAMIYGKLIYILLIQTIFYPHLQGKAWKDSQSWLSFLKLSNLLASHSVLLFGQLLARAHSNFLQQALCKFSAYDKRQRPNIMQQLAQLG
jgi:hypothetical protein